MRRSSRALNRYVAAFCGHPKGPDPRRWWPSTRRSRRDGGWSTVRLERDASLSLMRTVACVGAGAFSRRRAGRPRWIAPTEVTTQTIESVLPSTTTTTAPPTPTTTSTTTSAPPRFPTSRRSCARRPRGADERPDRRCPDHRNGLGHPGLEWSRRRPSSGLTPCGRTQDIAGGSLC